MQLNRWAATPRRAAVTAGLAAAAATALALAATSPADDAAGGDAARDGAPAKNVIFLVGDGLASAQRELIRLRTVGLEDDLVMNRLPVSGQVHTSSTDPVTDSAAGATAWAIGEKTYDGAIGVDREGREVDSVLDHAREAGKATGLVTTGQVTDASPAAFGASVVNRSAQTEIARQYLEESRVDVLLGGGEDFWYPEGEPGAFPDAPAEDPTEGSRSDQGDLVERARDLGYRYVTDGAALRRARGRKLLGLFANQEMFQQRPEGEGDVYSPVVSLPDMAAAALRTLRRDRDGFFLLVEEEGIDEFAHNNNAARTAQTGAQFDRTVQTALNFAAAEPGTLIITVGDHETGGMTIESVDEEDESGDGESAEDGPFTVAGSDQQFVVDWTTTEHTADDVPLTAAGPRARNFEGVYENTAIYDGLLDALDLEDAQARR